MTNSNYWDDARLSQLAATAAANTEAIRGLREQQEVTNRSLDILIGIVNGQQQHINTMLEEIRDIKVDIRGLQLENRRMLEELRGRRDDEEP